VTIGPSATARTAQSKQQEVVGDDQHGETVRAAAHARHDGQPAGTDGTRVAQLRDAALEYGWSVITLTPR